MSLAKWYKIDFHVHTPESSCFPDKTVDADKWLSAAKNSGVNGVVVTDHNSIGFLEKIDAVKGNYEKENEFKVFYGIEVCVSAEFTHFIIIFNDSLTLEAIKDDVVQHLGLRRENWGDTTRQVSEDKLIELYKERKNNIFIIPAHFASNKGLGTTNINAIKKYSQNISFAAVEVRNDEDVREYRNKVSNNVIESCALITGSDNPLNSDESKHALEGIGKTFTWVKTATLDFEGLRQVFIDPDYRVINYLKLIEIGKDYNPNIVMKNYISGIELKGFKHIDNMNIRFSPHFNCIVGSRGSGKSTFVESIRASLHGEKSFENKDILKKTLNKDGQITTYYNFGTTNPYKIQVTKESAKKYSYLYENNEGVTSEPPSFQADIYSQKEIFSLVENDKDVALSDESPLIRIIDSKESSDIFTLKDTMENIKTELLNEGQRILKYRSRYQELSVVRSEIKSLETVMKQFEESGLENKRKEYEKIQNVYKNQESKIQSIQSVYLRFIDSTDDLVKKMVKVHESDDTISFDDFDDLLIQSLEKVKSIVEHEVVEITGIFSKLVESQLSKKMITTESEYQTILESVRSIGNSDVPKIDEQLRNLKERERDLIKFKEEEDISVKHIEDLVENYINTRIELISARKSIIEETNNDTLKIDIEQMGHSDRLIRNMQVEFGKEETYNNYFAQVCKQIIDPKNNYENFKKYIIFLLTSLDGDINQFLDEECSETRFVKMWKDKKEKNTLSSLLNILPEDKVNIRISDNGSEIDINDGSPGQKCAAVLAFLLSNGKNPLIIDQPEDDLDNSLIYNLIVDSIRKMKLERQIIIVSHNPNIPVLGDAEGIIILERNKDGKVSLFKNKKAGCIEEKVIRDGICDIMEGGEIAFKKREMKYMYRKQ